MIKNLRGQEHGRFTYEIRLKHSEVINPPYEMFIQLTIRSSDGTEIQRMKCNCKLHKAFKCLNEFMFGGRHSAVKVHTFTLKTSILRLPVGAKFEITSLRFQGKVAETIEALIPIIDDSSYPFDDVEFDGYIDGFQNEIVKNARCITIWNHHRENWLPILRNLTHQIVHIRNVYNDFSNEDRIILIQDWLEKGRPNGTRFRFGMNKNKTIIDLFELIREQFNQAVFHSKSVTLPINNFTSVLVVQYESVANQKQFECEWVLIIKVRRAR